MTKNYIYSFIIVVLILFSNFFTANKTFASYAFSTASAGDVSATAEAGVNIIPEEIINNIYYIIDENAYLADNYMQEEYFVDENAYLTDNYMREEYLPGQEEGMPIGYANEDPSLYQEGQPQVSNYFPAQPMTIVCQCLSPSGGTEQCQKDIEQCSKDMEEQSKKSKELQDQNDKIAKESETIKDKLKEAEAYISKQSSDISELESNNKKLNESNNKPDYAVISAWVIIGLIVFLVTYLFFGRKKRNDSRNDYI